MVSSLEIIGIKVSMSFITSSMRLTCPTQLTLLHFITPILEKKTNYGSPPCVSLMVQSRCYFRHVKIVVKLLNTVQTLSSRYHLDSESPHTREENFYTFVVTYVNIMPPRHIAERPRAAIVDAVLALARGAKCERRSVRGRFFCPASKDACIRARATPLHIASRSVTYVSNPRCGRNTVAKLEVNYSQCRH
jgi:hypothetical protein